MAGRGLFYSDSAAAANSCFNNGILLQKQSLIPSLTPTKEANIASLLVPAACSPSFYASGSMVSFRDVNGGKKSDRSFFQSSLDQEENDTDDLEEYLHQPEKKRRLTAGQVQFLEKSFEVENKLEPERKVQLAKELGLEPRQIAIWFQNRRARWKTRQLERDYEALRNKYDNLKADYGNLLKEKEDLKAEVIQLTDKLLLEEKEKGEIDIKKLPNASANENVVDPDFEVDISQVSAVVLKHQEDLNSAKSDVFDSESPHYTDVVQSSILDQGDSSYVFEPELSDLSQDEEENFGKNLLAKDEHDHYPTSSNLSYFGFPVEDQGFGFWSF